MEFIEAWLMGQTWYMTAFQVVGMATSITLFISDKWAYKIPVLKQINAVMNFVSGNFFRNKNK